ncbi:hypothetical protein TNCV_2331971 [Trichonephila clavipes]|nr:hypothetical protein TNCV_2331971 [Trichonephila clavipes]
MQLSEASELEKNVLKKCHKQRCYFNEAHKKYEDIQLPELFDRYLEDIQLIWCQSSFRKKPLMEEFKDKEIEMGSGKNC